MASFYPTDYFSDQSVMSTSRPGVVCFKRFSVAVTTALAANDIVYLARLPPNTVPLYIGLYSTDIDTGAAALKFDCGTTADTDMFGDEIVLGQAAGAIMLPTTLTATAQLAAQFNSAAPTAEYDLILTCTVTAATPAAGTITGWVMFGSLQTPLDPTFSSGISG